MTDEDEAAKTTRWEQAWPNRWVLSGTRTYSSDPHAKSGTSDETSDNDDAEPVMKEEEEVDALEKLKKDKEAMMKRIIYDGERSSTKAFTLKSGLKVVLPSKKGKKGGKRRKKKTHKKRRKKKTKKRRKKNRKKRTKRRRL